MAAVNPLMMEQVWFDKYRCEDAETAYYEQKSGCVPKSGAEQQTVAVAAGADSSVLAKIVSLEKENQELRQVTQNLAAVCKKLEERITALEKAGTTNNHKQAQPAAAPAKKEEPKKEEEDEEEDSDFELFGDDDEDEVDEEAEKLKAERVAAYAAKKSKKTAVIAKSSLLLDVKPWDDETDMAELEKCVRGIEMEGLLWGAGKLVPVGYGIKKLVINAVIEDDKVSTDDLEEKIVGFEDFVQSMDIAAFNKI